MGEPPDGWRDAYRHFDKVCQTDKDNHEEIEKAFKKLGNLVFNDNPLDEPEWEIEDHIIHYCKFRRDRLVVQENPKSLNKMKELYEESLEAYNDRKNNLDFLTMHWINHLGQIVSTLSWYNCFDMQQLNEVDDNWREWLDKMEKMSGDFEINDKIRRDVYTWLPPYQEDLSESSPWLDSLVWLKNLQVMEKEYRMELIELKPSEDVHEIHEWWMNNRSSTTGKHNEFREREFNIALMLMANYCANLDNKPEENREAVADLFSQIRNEFDEEESIGKSDLDAATGGIIECLALAIISDIDDVKTWYEKMMEVGHGGRQHDRFWRNVHSIYENLERPAEVLKNWYKILIHLRDGLDQKPEVDESEQFVYKFIVEKLWDKNEMTNIQKRFFDSKFSKGTTLYQPSGWKKRGLTYLHEGKLRKVWFEKEENIKKLVDMTNRGFEEFNADVGANYDGNERGPFGIHLHSWEAYEKAVEVSKTVRGLLDKYRKMEKDQTPNEVRKEIKEKIVDICTRSAWRLSFIVEDVELESNGNDARKTALWVRAFIDDEVDGSGTRSVKYTEKKENEGVIRKNPLIILNEVLNGYKGKITKLYERVGNTPYYSRKRKSSDSEKSTGMVHDDERFSNILGQPTSNQFVIDFEHSHYAKKTEEGHWTIVSVRDERPFRLKAKEGEELSTFRHLEYRWEGDLYPDVLRSHAAAVANMAIETMNRHKDRDPLFGIVDEVMFDCVDEAIKECEKWMDDKWGSNRQKTEKAKDLYRVHLIDRCIEECLFGQGTFEDAGEKEDFEAWFRRLLDRFLDRI